MWEVIWIHFFCDNVPIKRGLFHNLRTLYPDKLPNKQGAVKYSTLVTHLMKFVYFGSVWNIFDPILALFSTFDVLSFYFEFKSIMEVFIEDADQKTDSSNFRSFKRDFSEYKTEVTSCKMIAEYRSCPETCLFQKYAPWRYYNDKRAPFGLNFPLFLDEEL